MFISSAPLKADRNLDFNDRSNIGSSFRLEPAGFFPVAKRPPVRAGRNLFQVKFSFSNHFQDKFTLLSTMVLDD